MKAKLRYKAIVRETPQGTFVIDRQYTDGGIILTDTNDGSGWPTVQDALKAEYLHTPKKNR